MPVDPSQPVHTPETLTPIAQPWGAGVADSVIQRFVDATERDAAWISPPEGGVCWLEDRKVIQVFYDATWTSMLPGGLGSMMRVGTGRSIPPNTWTPFNILAHQANMIYDSGHVQLGDTTFTPLIEGIWQINVFIRARDNWNNVQPDQSFAVRVDRSATEMMGETITPSEGSPLNRLSVSAAIPLTGSQPISIEFGHWTGGNKNFDIRSWSAFLIGPKSY